MLDMVTVNTATDEQNTPSNDLVKSSDVHHAIFSDPNSIKMEAIFDTQVPKALLTPAFSHRR